PWPSLLPRLVERSVQAVVPTGHGFPEEWADDQDIYPPRRAHFENLCDILYRYEHALTLAPGMTGPLAHDSEGNYRSLIASGSILVRDHDGSPHLLSLQYDGDAGAVKVRVGERTHAGTQTGPDRAQILVRVGPDESDLALTVDGAIKLRSITWTPETAPAH